VTTLSVADVDGFTTVSSMASTSKVGTSLRPDVVSTLKKVSNTAMNNYLKPTTLSPPSNGPQQRGVPASMSPKPPKPDTVDQSPSVPQDPVLFLYFVFVDSHLDGHFLSF